MAGLSYSWRGRGGVVAGLGPRSRVPSRYAPLNDRLQEWEDFYNSKTNREGRRGRGQDGRETGTGGPDRFLVTLLEQEQLLSSVHIPFRAYCMCTE